MDGHLNTPGLFAHISERQPSAIWAYGMIAKGTAVRASSPPPLRAALAPFEQLTTVFLQSTLEMRALLRTPPPESDDTKPVPFPAFWGAGNRLILQCREIVGDYSTWAATLVKFFPDHRDEIEQTLRRFREAATADMEQVQSIMCAVRDQTIEANRRPIVEASREALALLAR